MWHSVFRSHFIPMFFSKTVLFGFPLDYQPSQTQSFGHWSVVRYGYLLMNWVLSHIRQWVVTSIAFVPLLYQHIVQSDHHCRLNCLWLDLHSPFSSAHVQSTIRYCEQFLVVLEALERHQLDFSVFNTYISLVFSNGDLLSVGGE